MNKKLSVISVCSTGLAVSSSQGALILNNFADISVDQGGSTTIAYYDFETATASTVLTAAHDYSIRASAIDPDAFIVTALKPGYSIFGGEFFTGGEHAGGEVSPIPGTQNMVRAYQTGNVLGPATPEMLFGQGIAITSPSISGPNYDFGRPVGGGGNTAIGLAFTGGEAGNNYGFINAEEGSLVLLGGGVQTTANTPITVANAATGVPEPGSLSLLAMGLLGISQYRRRRAS